MNNVSLQPTQLQLAAWHFVIFVRLSTEAESKAKNKRDSEMLQGSMTTPWKTNIRNLKIPPF